MSKKFQKEKNKILGFIQRKWMLLAIIIALAIVFVYGFNITFNMWHNSLLAMFGSSFVSLIALHFLAAIIVGYIYYEFRKFAHELGEKFNKWFTLTIVISFVLLYVGTIAINYTVSPPNLDSVLRDRNNNQIVGVIDCLDESQQNEISFGGQYIVGNRVICKVTKPELQQFDAAITLTDKDDIPTTFHRQNEIWFIALENTKRIYFEIDGIDSKGERLSLHVSRNMVFPTQDESAEISNKMLAYFIALVGVVLFSVPSAMVNLQKLYRDKE
ncbi:MAG: hypothetical protein HYX24_02405 [Candidatus Aenigmarchaeota archaeon]|nr:hypothetical protein [Candidatus Aenigmarchaeota archaeon]